MKILHVTEAYGGGVLSVVNQLAIGHQEEGHNVTLAMSLRPEAPSNWRSELPDGIVVRRLSLSREISLKKDFQGLVELAHLFKSEAPDAIHLHSSKAGFLGRVAARFCGLSGITFYSPHAFAYLAPDVSPKKRIAYRWLEKLGARFGGLLIACSNDELLEARKLGVRAEVVNNGIDVHNLEKLVQDVSRNESDVVRIVSAGRLCAAKRPDFFVKVAEEIQRRGLPAEFVWIGGGEPPPLTTAARFTGWLARDVVLRKLRESADIYVQTSSYEGLPISVLESQSLGIPAVVTDAVGNRSAVENGKTGFVSSVSSVNDFADKVELLIKDRSLRVKMGIAAKERITAQFDASLMLRGYLACYSTGDVKC
jgi:glycosyltransferase involved in cell wall biosynthesis